MAYNRNTKGRGKPARNIAAVPSNRREERTFMGFNFKALQQMQSRMLKMQEELQNTVFEGTSGGDAVKISMNGKFEVTSVKLDPEVIDPADSGMLEDLILTACQDAFTKVADAQARLMGSVTGGLKLPPGMGF